MTSGWDSQQSTGVRRISFRNVTLATNGVESAAFSDDSCLQQLVLERIVLSVIFAKMLRKTLRKGIRREWESGKAFFVFLPMVASGRQFFSILPVSPHMIGIRFRPFTTFF